MLSFPRKLKKQLLIRLGNTSFIHIVAYTFSPSPENLIDDRHFALKTPDVTIQVNPARSDLVQTRVIDGVKYILINAEESVEVNGVDISIGDKA